LAVECGEMGDGNNALKPPRLRNSTKALIAGIAIAGAVLLAGELNARRLEAKFVVPSICDLREHLAWSGGLFITNALDKHAETELPLANGIDLPTQRRIALNQPRTIGLDVRFDY
jgi:hypothetical protein